MQPERPRGARQARAAACEETVSSFLGKSQAAAGVRSKNAHLERAASFPPLEFATQSRSLFLRLTSSSSGCSLRYKPLPCATTVGCERCSAEAGDKARGTLQVGSAATAPGPRRGVSGRLAGRCEKAKGVLRLCGARFWRLLSSSRVLLLRRHSFMPRRRRYRTVSHER